MFADSSDDDDVSERCAPYNAQKRTMEDQKRIQDKLNNLPTLQRLLSEEDPNAFTHEQIVEAAQFVHELIEQHPQNNKEIEKCQRRLQQKYHKSFKKSLLLSGYKYLLTNENTKYNNNAAVDQRINVSADDKTTADVNTHNDDGDDDHEAMIDVEELVTNDVNHVSRTKIGNKRQKAKKLNSNSAVHIKDNNINNDFTNSSNSGVGNSSLSSVLCSNAHRYLPLEHFLVSKAPRSQSGVLVITVFTSPYPDGQKFSCQWNCYYCPNEPGQPRSYLLNEPGVRRANRLAFDPIRQFHERVHSLIAIGHPADKVELMVLGGTWESYPCSYRERFMRDLFYAANTVFDELNSNESKCINDNSNTAEEGGDEKEKEEHNETLQQEQHEEQDKKEDQSFHKSKRQHRRRRPPLDLAQEQMLNESAMCKIIGVTLETRPDTITPEMLCELRRLGCTRLQLGVQHTDDGILEYVNRQCTREDTMRALKLLKDSCFKVDIHLMPDLPGSSPEIDKCMFDDVLHSPNLQADQWKIYPCQTTPFTVIEEWYKSGKYTPYGLDALIEVILHAKRNVHPWIRLNRVIRDIPVDYVLAGVEVSNLRQLLAVKLKQNNEYCKCIRCREVKGDAQVASKLATAHLIERTYSASEGTEIFLSFETPDERTIFAFLRLRINIVNSDCPFTELEHCALIRELHVYGNLITTYGEGDLAHRAQHSGLGTRLLTRAEEIALNAGYERIAVISGIGVRDYYRRRGYYLDNTYSNHGGFMIKKLSCTNSLQHEEIVCTPTSHHNPQLLPNNTNNDESVDEIDMRNARESESANVNITTRIKK